jgi:MFS family permease
MKAIEPTTSTDPARLDAGAWATLLVLCGAQFLDSLDISMIGVSLPSIRAELHMSTSSLQWVVSSYVLGYGGFLLLGGRTADLLGRRRVLLTALGAFLLASALGGLASDGTTLILARFLKGVSAAFTAPAALSIITTSFSEGPARNRALSIFTATGASAFSLGLVFGGLLTELSWRWVFFVPVAVALVTLLAARRVLPSDRGPIETTRQFDLAGAISVTAAMLLLVFTLVEATAAGWASARTLGSLAATAALLVLFVRIEQRSRAPLVRLGILRSGSLVQANLGAMALFGGWVVFLFVATLYMQQLLGYSPLQTGLAIFPSGVVVVALAPRLAKLIARFGTGRLICAGLLSHVAAYALFGRIGLESSYAAVILPTVLLGGLGFALAYGPLNVAATSGVAPTEQGLAGGLLTSSMQFGGALVLALATAVDRAAAGPGRSPQALLEGFRAAILVSLCAAIAGVLATVIARRQAAGEPNPVCDADPA